MSAAGRLYVWGEKLALPSAAGSSGRGELDEHRPLATDDRQQPPWLVPVVSIHQPMAQSWICLACSMPWPCPTRRRQLLGQYADTPVSLALLLGSAMIEASATCGTCSLVNCTTSSSAGCLRTGPSRPAI
jgi:hypothetical protein